MKKQNLLTERTSDALFAFRRLPYEQIERLYDGIALDHDADGEPSRLVLLELIDAIVEGDLLEPPGSNE